MLAKHEINTLHQKLKMINQRMETNPELNTEDLSKLRKIKIKIAAYLNKHVTSSSSNILLSLPLELKILIFIKLDVGSITRLRQVSSELRALLDV